jgi:hypothetical protein
MAGHAKGERGFFCRALRLARSNILWLNRDILCFLAGGEWPVMASGRVTRLIMAGALPRS